MPDENGYQEKVNQKIEDLKNKVERLTKAAKEADISKRIESNRKIADLHAELKVVELQLLDLEKAADEKVEDIKSEINSKLDKADDVYTTIKADLGI